MDERRKYIRFPVQLDARYTEKNEENWKECSVIDISREGMGISIYARDIISKDALLHIQITLPVEKEPVVVEGTLIWIRDLREDPRFNYIGGVTLTSIRPEDKWLLMDYAYEGWHQKEDR